MFKAALTFLAIASLVSIARAQSEPKSSLSVLGLEDEEDIFPEEEEFMDGEQTRTVGDVSAVLLAIKNQFKDILQELALQVFGYIKDILHHFRIKLLKKLGMYTLKDVFHTVFDGVSDFVTDETPEVVYYKKEISKPVSEPSIFGDGFSLASLFKSAQR